jgi:predicted DNA-binding transcriptional regulator YafY
MFAYCVEKQDYRLFKLSRISKCEPVSGTFSKEPGNIEWLMKNKSGSDQRKYYHIRLLCKNAILQQALEYLNRNTIEEHENGTSLLPDNSAWVPRRRFDLPQEQIPCPCL